MASFDVEDDLKVFSETASFDNGWISDRFDFGSYAYAPLVSY